MLVLQISRHISTTVYKLYKIQSVAVANRFSGTDHLLADRAIVTGVPWDELGFAICWGFAQIDPMKI